MPIGAHATVTAGWLQLTGIVASPDGTQLIRARADGPAADAESLGRALGEDLLARGAREILQAVYSA